jgi:hypothetical protein
MQYIVPFQEQSEKNERGIPSTINTLINPERGGSILLDHSSPLTGLFYVWINFCRRDIRQKGT